VVLPCKGEIGSLFGRFNSLFDHPGNLSADLRYSNNLSAPNLAPSGLKRVFASIFP
jgi:hypothetical protein